MSQEGSLAVAIAALLLVLGLRFAGALRAHERIAFASYAAALVASLLAARGIVPAATTAPGVLVRVAGAALLVGGLLLAAAASKVRRGARPGALVTEGPYRRVRRPVEAGLALVLVGHLLRAPSSIGFIAVAVAIATLGWSARREDRLARESFGAEWTRWAEETPFVVPGLQRGKR
jgi:protein-S-isoprenylcysteine O-methyltransferase Ste14